MRSKLRKQVLSAYERWFDEKPTFIVTAPGRINLIGEHTDYSDGFVLPVAIDRNVTIAFTPREDDLVHIYSVDFNEEIKVQLGHLKRNLGGWKDYVTGMAWSMIDSGLKLSGWQGVIAGDIPIGAGLSSSAALEVAAGKTFCLSSDIKLSPTKLALISKKAESEWVGVNVGIMDQLISSAGKQGHALLLDCRSLTFDYVPIPHQAVFIILDTQTRRELTHSDYNVRHEEVRKAATILGIQHLRDATPSFIEENQNTLPPILYKRAKHVARENERVKLFSNAMRNSNLLKMGELINESHVSLRDDFEVSSPELNLIVDLAQSQSGCVGARMMGAGFGGCALALLNIENVGHFTDAITTTYYAETGIKPHIFKVESAYGVRGFSAKNF